MEYFFLVTGRDNTLWIELKRAGIRQVLARSEAAATYMADAYARVTGKPTFVYGGYGPGAANVAGAIAEAYWSSSPLIALPSTMVRANRHKREYQDLDQKQLFAAVTKWGAEVDVVGQVPRLLREATRQAMSGTPGPVYLGIPSDVFEEEVPNYQEPAPYATPMVLPLSRPAPADADVDAALDALVKADRPMILAGNGIHQSCAYEALRQVAERLAIPIVTSLAGKGSIAETHELAVGAVGRYSRDYANAALRGADVVLAIGTGLGGMATDGYKLIAPTADLIHVTVDSSSIGQNFPTRLGLAVDAQTFLCALLDACDRMEVSRPERSEYLGNLASAHEGWRDRRTALAGIDGTNGSPMHPAAVMSVVDEKIAEDAIVVGDTGYAAAWAGALIDLRAAGRHFLRADGSLGWAFSGALGAQLAAPEKQVICVIGDGGWGYHVGELETALRLELPVVAVVLNNGTLAFEAHVQSLYYNELVNEVNDFCDVDYGQIARAFGAKGVRVHTVAELRDALDEGLQRTGPMVIDAMIDREAIPPVTRYDTVRTRDL